MQGNYYRSFQESKRLSKLNTQMTEEFANLKNELLKNNSTKDQELSKIQAELAIAQKQQSNMAVRLENMESLFDNQKQYGNNQGAKVMELQKELRTLKAKNTSLEYSLEVAQNRAESTASSINELRQQLASKNTEGNQYQLQINEKQKDIDTLKKQASAHKKTLEQLSESFIELRKQLLRAKGKGEIVDPNQSKHIQNIAKALNL